MGYAFNSPLWLVYNPITRRVLRSRSVAFNEAWNPSPLSTSEEPTLLPTSPSNQSGEPLHFLTAFDDFEDEPFVPPTIVEVSPPPITSARQLADEEALIIRRATNPRSRSEIQALAQVAAALTLPPSTARCSICC